MRDIRWFIVAAVALQLAGFALLAKGLSTSDPVEAMTPLLGALALGIAALVAVAIDRADQE